MRHKWADLIHLWAEGAEIQHNYIGNPDDSGWMDCEETICWDSENLKFRVKPKKLEWWENIPEHGVLARSEKYRGCAVFIDKPVIPSEWTPLTNEEIERFKR